MLDGNKYSELLETIFFKNKEKNLGKNRNIIFGAKVNA